MSGLLLLILVALALVVLVLTIVIVYDATRPPRRTAAYAAAYGLPFDPGDLGYEFEEWTLERLDGARLPVWEVALGDEDSEQVTGVSRPCGSSHGRDDRATVLFIHGWGQSRLDCLKQIDSVREVARAVVLYDLRGHGEATGVSRLGNREADDLLALLERLGTADRFILIGRGLGANIAISAATRESGFRDRIAGVIAIQPYNDFHATFRQRLSARDFPSRPMSDLAMIWFTISRRVPLEIDERLQSDVRCPLLRLDEDDPDAIKKFLRSLRP